MNINIHHLSRLLAKLNASMIAPVSNHAVPPGEWDDEATVSAEFASAISSFLTQDLLWLKEKASGLEESGQILSRLIQEEEKRRARPQPSSVKALEVVPGARLQGTIHLTLEDARRAAEALPKDQDWTIHGPGDWIEAESPTPVSQQRWLLARADQDSPS